MSRKADQLQPIAQSLLTANKITKRQYRIWYLTEIEGMTVWAISQFLDVPRRTVEREQRRARAAIDLAILEDEEDAEGVIQFGLTVQRGAHGAGYAEDYTAKAAHEHLGFGLVICERKAA